MFIYEDFSWWEHIIQAYNSYEKGFLPHSGGMSDQPALFSPTMSIISTTLREEEELQEFVRKQREDMIATSQEQSKRNNLRHGEN